MDAIDQVVIYLSAALMHKKLNFYNNKISSSEVNVS